MKPKELGQLFLEHYPVDENGYSAVAQMDDLVKIHPDFKTSNGCTWARSNTSWLGKQFEIDRIKTGRSITAVQLVGFNERISNHSIPAEVKTAYKDGRCAVLDISTTIELDHKNARYNQESYTVEDFQPLNKTVNDAKRQHCKVCRATGKRFDARVLGSNVAYYRGDENTPECEGCYWHDPHKFWQKVTIKEI